MHMFSKVPSLLGSKNPAKNCHFINKRLKLSTKTPISLDFTCVNGKSV